MAKDDVSKPMEYLIVGVAIGTSILNIVVAVAMVVGLLHVL